VNLSTPDFLHTTRVSYDAIAKPYSEQFADHLGEQPLDLALVTAFAESVRAASTAPVADVGSGRARP
jgi:hypothetical protein